MSDLNPETLRLLKQMTRPADDPDVDRAPLDPSKLDGLALGDLWATARSVPRGDGGPETLAVRTASAIFRLGLEREPIFRGIACRDYLLVLAREAEEEPDKDGYSAKWIWERVCFALRRCTAASFEGFGAAAMRLLAATTWQLAPVMAVAVARLVGETTVTRVLDRLAADLPASPLRLDEARTAVCLDFKDHLALANVIQPDKLGGGDGMDTPHHRLSVFPAYAAFAETGLKQAAEHLRKIHTGKFPYVSDKAFTLDDSAVIARLARVALDRDETWLPPVLHELFLKASLAPTTAKTVPSQSVAIALGHAVQAFPTPEAIATLRAVLAAIRHAGVEKKLRRNLPLAERGLANRPDVASRLSLDRPMTKAELAALTRSLETSLALSITLRYADWRARLGEHPQVGKLAGTLIWRLVDARGNGTAVLPIAERGGAPLRDVNGAAIMPHTDGTMVLWHPSDTSADERNAWRERIVALRIKQPFKQAFREHYVVPDEERTATETAMFAGHTVAIRPFLGLACREGWVLDDDVLTRAFGPWKAALVVAHELIPGATGATTTRNLELRALQEGKPVPVRLGDLPPAALSEVLRAVDLLVSTSGIAMTGGDPWDDERGRQRHLQDLGQKPLGAVTAMRKLALERLLQGREDMADLSFGARHLRLGPYAIHLATARVTRDGEPVTIDPPNTAAVAMPWLPYEEKLLETIVYTAIAVAAQSRG